MTETAADHQLFFPALDILRGFAAVSVVLYHVIQLTQWKNFALSWPTLWFRLGWMGVDIFFVLSGFVVTLAALRRQAETAPGSSFYKQFMRARLARIAPLHYLTCAIYVAIYGRHLFAHVSTAVTHILSHATFLHNLSINTNGSINGVNWSLAVEMQFYIVVMLLAHWLSRAHPATVFVGGTCISWAWRLAAFMKGRNEVGGPVSKTWFYTCNVPGNADLFSAGAALAIIVFSRKHARALRFFHNTQLCIVLSSITLFGALTLVRRFIGRFWQTLPMVVFFKTLMSVGWALLIAAFCGVSKNVYDHMLMRPFMYAGEVSYGIYLWHSMVLSTTKMFGLGSNPALTAAVTLTATFALASLSWHLFEKPLVHTLHKRQTSNVSLESVKM